MVRDTERAGAARLLLETTAMSTSEVAFAAGFDSVRHLDETVHAVFAMAPSALREGTHARASASAPGFVALRLTHRRPLWPGNVFGHLVATAVPGVEEWRDGAYRRTLRLPFGTGIVALSPRAGHIFCRLTLSDARDVATAIARCRRLLDLDADPVAIDNALAQDPVLRPLVAEAPGRRVPRTVDGSELALRVVLGQQVSTAAARTHAARLVARCGEPIADPHGGLTHLFPAADAVASVDPETLAMPGTRRRTLLTLARALASGELDLDAGTDGVEARERLAEMPGIGPWTSSTIAMRALDDPDAFLPGDLGVRAGATALGLPATPGALTRRAERWRPWRSYAVQHLWGVGDHPINHFPGDAARTS